MCFFKVREWIEEQDREDGDGKGLFAVFDKPKDEEDQLTATVTFPKADEIDRAQDAQKTAISAPGALYPVLPLWVAEGNSCKDDLLDLSKYKTKSEDGGVVGWPVNKEPAKDTETEFVIKVKSLEAKKASEVAPSSSWMEARDELCEWEAKE